MCVKDKKCETWISLESVGIPVEGCLRNREWLHQINEMHVPCNQPSFLSNIYVNLPHIKITCIRNVAHGNFGYIDLAKVETAEGVKEVYVKRPIIHGTSLISEACIQKMVGESLEAAHFPKGAPKVIRIFKLLDGSVCFAMEQIMGACTLDVYLDSIPPNQLPAVIIDCIIQLCAMKWHLHNEIGMNHRDLKPSNCLIVECVPETKFITIDNHILELSTKHSLTLIDFGFACIGNNKTYAADLSLSTVYPKADPCPKVGRDMFLFLGLLYIDYHIYFPSRLIHLFESWLQEPGSKLCHFMKTDKENSKKWLYFITGNEDIVRFNSCPKRIISDLRSFC